MLVYVLSKDFEPLMPCTPVIARLLLKQGKAKVKRREPFTIRLLYETSKYMQDLTLGIDTGSGKLAAAAYTEDGKIVYLSEVELRNDITKKMEQRRKYRRNRRSRKTRYRKPRFNNRKKSIRKGRYSPTVESKVHSHEKEIESIRKILPVNKIVLETGQFDPHLMKNPALSDPNVRHWGYQKGVNYGYENTRAMVLVRDAHTCQCCKGKHKDTKLEVHHIIYRSNGGSDDPGNLITLCHTCHKALHDGKIHPGFKGRKKGQLKHATQMNVIRTRLLGSYPDAIETVGSVTKPNRLRLGLPKEHFIDACVIASEGKLFEIKSCLYRKKCVSARDRQRTKGIRSEKKIPTGKIMGFRKFDKVRYLGKEYFVKGRMSTGYATLMDINGKKADFSGTPKGYKTPKLKNMKRIQARSSWMVISEAVTQNIA